MRQYHQESFHSSVARSLHLTRFWSNKPLPMSYCFGCLYLQLGQLKKAWDDLNRCVFFQRFILSLTSYDYLSDIRIQLTLFRFDQVNRA